MFFGKVAQIVLLTVAGISLAGVSSLVVRQGFEVTIDYTLTVDQKVEETTLGKEPVTLVVGSGAMMSGVEARLIGMKKGEKKEFILPPEEGFGRRDPDLVRKVSKKELAHFGEMTVGDTLVGETADGMVTGHIVAVGKKTVIVDLNHPLAGKELHFSVEILEVN